VLLLNLQELWDTAIHSAQENRIDNDRKSKQVFNKVATLQAHHHQMPKDRCTPDGFPKMNPMRRQLLISLLLLFLVARSAMAQTFPVQASTNIVPPYSTLLADYVAPGSQRLALNIFLADLNRPQLQTRLRLRIEGEGISITTRPSFMPPPLILQGGIPERLSGTDLAEYFLPQNLDFTGITRRQFESTGKLPEGLYRFCFEILEYNRGVKVSNAACTMAWLILNDPPLINWPDQGEKLTPQDPQYITFQWTPRHTGSPNSAFTTEYDFALVELWPANRNPNDAILTTPPIFETTTQSTTLIYGPEATPLVPGRSYAFRVRARAIIGTESYDLFKNQGYSEAIGFVYGDACTLPTNINARATSGERFNISWEPATVHTNFNVRYRPAIRTADQWYEETTFLQNLDIGGLMAETTYEYQVAAGCGPFLSEYSDIASVTTESRPPVNYTCGLPPEEYSFENREPLPQLNVDDVVLAGDFEVRMMEVSGSNGNFSGKGRALVPYLDNMLVVVEFDQVSVNTDYRMTGGQMDVKGFGADILPDGVNDFLDELDESLDAIENTLDDIATGLDVADSIADQVQDLANDILDDGPLTIEDEERLDAATVAMYLEGAQQAAEAAAGALAAALTPESIETAAREVARAMELTKRGKRLRQIHDNADTLDAIAVEFFASENYGFDISRYRQHRLHYNIMVTADDETHRIPWVATAAGQQETVSARLTGNTGTDAADVAFESDGTALQATMTGDTWSITLPAMEAGAQRSIVALSSTTGAILGKLDAIAYEPIGRKVNLVPVGSTPAGLNAGDILTALNDTYRQAVASWEVAVLDPLKVDGYTGTLQDDEQALLSVYSTGMREIIRAFEATGAVNEDEFYLFLVDRSQVGNTGYMPRKHRYGFIYMEDNPDVPRTVAHELGHGAFRLQHTFEEYPTIGGPRSTANLMDYGTGTKLRKYQWDLIHNPPLVIGLLEDEGEGALDVCFWTKSLLTYNSLFGKDHVLETYMPIYNEVKNNFEDYWNQSAELFKEYRFGDDKENNLALEADSKWTVRNATHYKKTDSTFFVDHAMMKIVKQEEGVVLHKEGITLARINLEGKDYNVAAYSLKHATNPNYVRVDELCDLVDNDSVQVYNDDGQSFIAFLNGGTPELVIQILTDDKDDVETWLKYMGILVEDERSWVPEIPPFWENWSWEDVIDAVEDIFTSDDEDAFKYIVSDDNALVRIGESPYTARTPNETIAQGEQTYVLDTVLNEGNKLYGRVIVKSSMDTLVTSLGNLTEVIDIEEKNYLMKEDFTALTLPYSNDSTTTTYKKDEEFEAYKKCGNYLKVKGEGEAVVGHWIIASKAKATDGPEFPITTDKLEDIFPNTDTARIADVVEVINEFSDDFDLTTKERMSHFLGQIGHESNSLQSLIESQNYSAENIYKKFLKVKRNKTGGGKTYKYCHLINDYNCSNLGGCPSNYSGPNRCSTEPTWLTDSTGAFATYSVWLDSGYSVKSSFVNNANLFNLTYSCRLGNSHYNSGDGSKYRGRGFIQLTGKSKYEELTTMWNEKFTDDQKDFAGDDYELVGTDVKVGLMVALFEWERLMDDTDYFKEAFEGDWSDENIKLIGRAINGSGKLNPSNGEADRINKSKKAYDKL
jgi:predicted chitinase